jgi:branched-chain amino acid transport system ATP-binding protein
MRLEITDLEAGYGNIRVLRGVSFAVDAGEIVTVLGRNGTGRSTTCKAVMGQITPTAGRVTLDGTSLAGKPSHAIARAGLGYVPEERLIFTGLTVEENLVIGAKEPARPGIPRWTIPELYDIFPRLRERRNVKAGFLSGGEQQMLTMFRTLMGNPAVILVDEPTEGLAPRIVEVVAETIREMKRRGLAVLLMEQKLALAFRVTDRVLVMGHGRIVFSGTAESFRADDAVRRQWLEVSG